MSQLGLRMSHDDEPTPRRRRRRGAVAVVVALVTLALVGGGVWFAVGNLGDKVRSALASAPEDFPGPGTGSVRVQVQPGESASDVGQALEKAGVVKSADAFYQAAASNPGWTKVQPGFYQLKKQMKASDAVAALLDPANRLTKKVTVPEGLRLDETVAVLVDKAGFAKADVEKALANAKALGLPAYAKGRPEGFLYPATYDVQPDDTPLSVLQTMVDSFTNVADELSISDASVGPHDLVTVASLVEAEARHPEDYGKVARVVYNRLAKNMPLQFDSTVNYALKADKQIVTFDDLGVKSAYNTYKHPGLPPGPIDSPGKAALQAAMDPPAGDWLYFVTTNPKTGETKFTASYDEFLKFKAELKANS